MFTINLLYCLFFAVAGCFRFSLLPYRSVTQGLDRRGFLWHPRRPSSRDHDAHHYLPVKQEASVAAAAASLYYRPHSLILLQSKQSCPESARRRTRAITTYVALLSKIINSSKHTGSILPIYTLICCSLIIQSCSYLPAD